ncbi:hypothetical protein J4Q44_G00365860 [Coregonus suidteri]
MKPAVDEMFPEGAGPYVDLDEAGGSSGLLMDLAANEKAVHSDFFNDFEDLFDDEDLQWLSLQQPIAALVAVPLDPLGSLSRSNRETPLHTTTGEEEAMAGGSRALFYGVFTAALLVTMLLPEFLSAGPVFQKLNGDVGDATEETVVAMASARRLVRNRRNISWYKQHSDFWNWYKYFTDNGNTEAVQELDRVYLAYLQNKNRAEGRRSYKAYLGHLGDIYKACADSEDPNCVASATSRPKPEPPKAPPKPAPVKACDPYRDPYCLYAAMAHAKSQPPPAPAPVKAPAPLYVRSPVAVKDPHSGYYYYSPAVQPFLSKEQKAELLRICSAEDVECLQYHLRAAFGHKPSAGPLPSYAHLGCDPKDPACKPQLVQKSPSGLFLRYPNCDPRDPRCAYAASLQAPRAPATPAPAGSWFLQPSV